MSMMPILILALWPALGMADPPPAEAPHPLSEIANQVIPAYKEWRVLEGRSGRKIPFEKWVDELATREVIYFGEEHRNHSHIEAALKVLQALLTKHLHPVLALEMFGWDGQAGLDRYVANPEIARGQFLRDSRWEQNWGGRFEDYEPLITFARQQRLSVLALNPPRPLVREVASRGLTQALADPDMVRWGMQGEAFPDEPAYRALILDQLRKCHGRMSESGYQHLYEASVFRDEGMAKTIAEFLRRKPGAGGPVVSYTGGGHIQYHVPVPDRVHRRVSGPVKQATVYLMAFEPGHREEIQHLLQAPIADYVWLTPLGAHGPPKRCR